MSDIALSHRIGPPLLAALLVAVPVQAQIVTDGSAGSKVSLSGGEIKIGADLGARRGDNLFHSFEKFGIATGQTATFTGPGTIKNVISRVTGGEISNIDGKLASTVGQADLYFLNPAGVMFGPNATLDVPGSFHVSTAHELRFADGARFSALDKTGSGLTVAPPEAFGFLDRPSGPIAVDQSQVEVPTGKTLSLIGGDLNIAGKQIDGVAARALQAENGTVNLASITPVGQFRFSDGAVEAVRQGNIQLRDHAQIRANGNGGGNIRVRGGVLTLQGSSLQAENTGERNGTGNIDVQAGEVRMSRGGNISTKTRVSGSAGSITLHAKLLSLSDDSSISSDASSNTSRGSGGQITVTATDVNLVDGSRIGNTNNSSLRPGAVTVQAEHLTLSNLSSIDSTALTASTGGSGNISVTAGTLRIHNNSNIRSETHSDIASSGQGNISIVITGSIELNKGGGIRTNTYRRQDAGIITVRADNIYISEDFIADNGETIPSSISSNAGDAGLASQGIYGSLIGNAGHVTVNARRIDLADGGTIQTESWGRGGGTITVHAAGHLVISGLSNTGILSRARRHRTTGNGAIGDAGSITVKAGTVELRDGGGIRTDTQSIGEGGTIKVEADSLLIFGRADTGGSITVDSGITSNASPGSAGNAGDVTVTTRELVMVRGGGPRSVAGISSATISSATAAPPSGNAGTVSISGRSVILANGGSISTENAGNGTGGTIQITARDTLQLDDAEIRARTTTKQGGDVTLNVGRLFELRNSRVTTSVAAGGGSGGSIQIKSPLMVLGNSEITADAIGGNGGNIFIDAGQLIRTPDSKITATGSVNGNITIAAPNTDVSSSLSVLPGTFLDASSQLRETCAARGGRPASSFSAGGRGGLPPDPGAPLAASPFGQPLEQQAATGSPTALTAKPRQAVKPITVAGIPQPVLGSPRLTCRE